jgi:GDP-L-fucose synthase
MTLLIGGSGLVGTGILRAFSLAQQEISAPSHSELDLLDFQSIVEYLRREKPKSVIMAAGTVGGIDFNSNNQLSQYTQNLQMNFNILEACASEKIEKLLLVSSSCIYPINAPIPLSEDSLNSGVPERSNAGYAAAKLAAINHLEFIRDEHRLNWGVCLPANVIGFEKNFFSDTHVVPSLIRKFAWAKSKSIKQVEIWGDGTPIREFIYNFELGRAIAHLVNLSSYPKRINIGVGESICISDLAACIAKSFKYEGEIIFDITKPNGHPNKSLDSSKIFGLGWKPNTNTIRSIQLIVEKYESSSNFMKGKNDY